MITEIWPGGQTGVEQGALEAARECGVRTGGWMPKGFLTEDGPRPEFAERFGVLETTTAEYPPRTRRNAKDTSGTVWIEGPGEVAQDRGYRTTLSAAANYAKPFLRIPLSEDPASAAAHIVGWAQKHNVQRLNVAGPRASRWPESHVRAWEIVRRLLSGSR